MIIGGPCSAFYYVFVTLAADAIVIPKVSMSSDVIDVVQKLNALRSGVRSCVFTPDEMPFLMPCLAAELVVRSGALGQGSAGLVHD